MAGIELTSKNFEQTISGDQPTLVDFWAPWCGPCHSMLPIIDQLTEEAAGFQVAKVNIDDNPDLASKFNVMSIPTFLIFKDGEVVDQISGATSKNQLIEAIQKAGK